MALIRAFRSVHVVRKIFLCIGIILLMGVGLITYVNFSLQKWSEEQQIEMHAEKWNIRWNIKSPQLIFKNITVKNHVPWDSFQKLFVEEMTLEFQPFAMLKNFFRTYEVFTRCKGVKLEEKSKSFAEIKQCDFFVVGNYSFYKIKEIKAEMIDIALTQEYTTIPDRPDNQPAFAHIFLYFLIGELQYDISQNILKLDLHVPRATSHMPVRSTYEVHVEGPLHFLDMSFPVPPKKTPLPLHGLIKITINNFSHFLNHLYQARVISNIVDNLGSIVGYPVSKEDIRLGKEEIFTNAVSLNLTVQPETVTLGSFKIYP